MNSILILQFLGLKLNFMRMKMPYRLQLERDAFFIYFFFHLWIHSFIHSFLLWKLIKIIEEHNVYFLEYSFHGWSISFWLLQQKQQVWRFSYPIFFIILYELTFITTGYFNFGCCSSSKFPYSDFPQKFRLK